MRARSPSRVLPTIVARVTSALALGAVITLGAACDGELGSLPSGPRGPATQPGETLGSSPVRRMTRFEYDNTVRDLLGDDTHPAQDFGAEAEGITGFQNDATNLVTTSAHADKYMRASEGIAERVVADWAGLTGCDASIGDDTCARDFLETFLPRAFRRPPTADERASFVGLYELGRTDTDARTGVSMVIEAVLQSPQFLYRLELGVPDAGGTTVALDGWEMASRLSYFLWGTMPDEALFEAARDGRLETAAGIEAEARRMIEDPRARAAVSEFHRQWLDYDRIANVGKDATLFPTWSPETGEQMEAETRAFIEHTIFDGEGTLTALLTAPSTELDPALATFYGPGVRAGLLSQGSLLTVNAHSNQTSPVHRGKLVRELLLCDVMPPPPADVVLTVPEPTVGSTARERFAQHSEDPACASCHTLMDPLGLGFEAFDAVGRWRELEEGEPVDARGELTSTDVDGPFEGVDELSEALATSEDVRRCYALQWLRYGFGRAETRHDAAARASIDAAFEASGGDILELLVALTQTDSFRTRSVESAR